MGTIAPRLGIRLFPSWGHAAHLGPVSCLRALERGSIFKAASAFTGNADRHECHPWSAKPGRSPEPSYANGPVGERAV